MEPAGTPTPRPLPIPADPRPPSKDPFAGLEDQLAGLQEQSLTERVATFTQIHQSLNVALSATALGQDESTGQGDRPDPRGPQTPTHGGR